MTLEQHFTSMLIHQGLWPNEAYNTINYAKTHRLMESIEYRWKENIEDYQSQPLEAVIWLNLQSIAAEWLKQHKPQHWAIPMFER